MNKVNLNENVSVKSHKHNCDFVKTQQKFILKVIIKDRNLPNCLYISSPIENDKPLTRKQILNFLVENFSYRSNVSLSKSFFSPFNSDCFYSKYKSDLNYFKNLLSCKIDIDFFPCAFESLYRSSFVYYYIAVPYVEYSL